MAAAQERSQEFMDMAFAPVLFDVCAGLWISSTFHIFPRVLLERLHDFASIAYSIQHALFFES